MPSIRLATLLLVTVALVAMPAAGTMQGADSTELETSGLANPSAPGMNVTHYVTVTVPNASDGATLQRLELNYTGTRATLTEGLSHGRASVVRNPESDNRTRIRLENVSLSQDGSTIQYAFPENRTLQAGDEVSVAIHGIENPSETGPIDVGVALDTDAGEYSGSLTLQIRTPAPSISPQGVVGSSTRIGIHDPLAADGFIVAYGADGTVLGTMALDPGQNINMDVGIEHFVEEEAEEQNGRTIRLVAVEDTNDNDAFDPTQDEPFVRDGNPVQATVEHAVFQRTTTSTTTADPTTPVTTTPVATSTATSPTTSSSTSTTTPGVGIAGAILAFLASALLVRRS